MIDRTIRSTIKDSIKTKEGILATQVPNIAKAAGLIIKSLKVGGKLIAFGNGGSASDSQHIAAELVGRFRRDRRALPALALSANTAALTAIANDYGYEAVFSRQIEALGRKQDVALAISTSGRSKNIIDAVLKARSIGMKVVALTGGDGGLLKKECDVSIVVGSGNTPRIQEAHITIGHILCELIESEMFK